jgi:hypothetical protein
MRWIVTGPCSGSVIVATAGWNANPAMGSASALRPPSVFLPGRSTECSAPDLNCGMAAVGLAVFSAVNGLRWRTSTCDVAIFLLPAS